jgi:peptidoglycan-associated lipoprotein
MRKNCSNQIVILAIFTALALLSGCHKKVAGTPAATQPPQPSPAAPTVTPSASASTLQKSEVPRPTSSLSLNELFQQDVKDAFFDYDKAAIRSDAQKALQTDADFLRLHPEVRFTIEGHCDERGSEEYNLGLGDRRARVARRYLENLGIADSRIQTTSYGKERPFCTEHNESCWRQNRRGHLTMTP